jgi:hypothetical protein
MFWITQPAGTALWSERTRTAGQGLYYRQGQGLFSTATDQLWSPSNLLFRCYLGGGGLFTRWCKWSKREVVHLYPYSADVKNEWSLTSTAVYAFIACWLDTESTLNITALSGRYNIFIKCKAVFQLLLMYDVRKLENRLQWHWGLRCSRTGSNFICRIDVCTSLLLFYVRGCVQKFPDWVIMK